MISLRRLYLASAIVVLLWLGQPECFGQDVVGYTAVLQSTNSSEIDGYSLTETSYAVANYYDAGVIGYLYDGTSQVDAKGAEGIGTAEAYPKSTSVHLGDTYTLYSEHYIIAYYYTPGVGFYNPYDYYPGTAFAPGDPGYAPGSSFTSGGGPGVVQQEDIYLGYTYLQFTPAPPQVSSISPKSVVRGTSGSFYLQGSHLQDDFGVFTVRALDGDNLSVASSDQNSASLNYTVAADATAGTHRFTVSNTWGESEPVTFTVNEVATGFIAQQNACPSDTDATSGFSLITASGLAIGGRGSMTVSFSHGSFNGFGITVPYGPKSTPESIASHLAALITKQYASSGLTAQAYGANILYKGRATLGAANFTSSDSSFTADPSPASCAPVSINLRLVPVMSADESVSGGLTILHNVWRLVTLAGGKATLDYGVVEHIAISKHGTVPDGQGGYQSPANSDITNSPYNIFNDGIGCLTQASCITNPPYWQKFTIKQMNGQGAGATVRVWTRIGGQDHLTNTIYEHGPNAPTYNNPNLNSGPLPQSPDPYNGTYICYLCRP